MIERLGKLSKPAKLALLVGIAVLAPVAAYAGYHVGIFLGSTTFD